MGKIIETDNIVLLLDNYSLESRSLHTSFKLAGKNYPVAVIDDDGFLPDDVISVYGYFLGDFKESDKSPGKPLYFNQITVPEYWEITANNAGGKIHNLNKERGQIFYSDPKHKRLVKIVDWYDEKGVARTSDHYNKYGALYARTVFNAKGQKVNKSYFSAAGKEVIVENYVTKTIILNDDDKVRIFANKKDFVVYFMKKTGFADCRVFFNTLSTSFFVSQSLDMGRKDDVLFWQEPVGNEIPGNMRVILEGNRTRTAKIMVQKKQAYDKLLKLGASESIVHSLGFIYPFKKENEYGNEVLICTNSDRIAQCRRLVEALPELHFNIAALTEMSSKLMDMERYSNVTLYPGARQKTFDELFEKCDLYLDINYESEIVSAVQTAFLNNLLIFAFKDTIHNPNYIAEEHIYQNDDAEHMITILKAVVSDRALLQKHLKNQHDAALLESAETYLQI